MILGLLIYLNTGALIWCFLDCTGVIDNTYANRNMASKRAMVLATLMMIVCWPVFVFSWVKGMLA